MNNIIEEREKIKGELINVSNKLLVDYVLQLYKKKLKKAKFIRKKTHIIVMYKDQIFKLEILGVELNIL